MALIKSNSEAISNSMNNPELIRNICILAHVDHGKTTIADLLLSTNGLISKRSAGFIRYLDDRKDEQERGITMKSSAVSLLHTTTTDGNTKNFVINLIDTPGHIDFSTEVTAAIRICDGAIIVVDVVEGICVQTKDAIKQAFDERIHMILLINKIDKLIMELNKAVSEIFQSIIRIIEDCNAYVAELCRYDFDTDENDALFSPETGNVIFASGLEGWAFTTLDIAQLFVKIVKNETVASLNSKIWNFDYYIDSNKNIKAGAIAKDKENLFIQMCLKTIHSVYVTLATRMEKSKLCVILDRLNITRQTREMTHNDPRVQVRAVLQAWQPLGFCVMNQCINVIPSPNQIDDRRLRSMINSTKYFENSILNEHAESMMEKMKQPESNDNSLTIVYTSKMFSVNKKNLSQNKPKVFIPSLQSREAVLAARKEAEERIKLIENDKEKLISEPSDIDTKDDKEDVSQENSIIGLARVFNGVLDIGQKLHIIPQDYDPKKENDIQTVTVTELYILLGRELILVDKVPCGNICGIGGLESEVVRTATLSNNLNCLPLIDRISVEPIVRNSIEPVNPKCLPILRKGLKLLMQSDSCVQVLMQETGEHVLLTAGDVHLAKCLEDLRTKFADIDINVSKPMVTLKETVVKKRKIVDFKINGVECVIEELGLHLNLTVLPLPKKIAKIIVKNFRLLRMVEDHDQRYGGASAEMKFERITYSLSFEEKEYKNENNRKLVKKLRNQLDETFKNCNSPWTDLSKKIWSVGKSHESINVLFNCTKNYAGRNIFKTLNTNDAITCIDNCIVNGFNMCCRAGPMCEEPIVNCAFIVTNFNLIYHEGLSQIKHKTQLMANVPVMIKQAFRDAFEKQAQRLMEPIFRTNIQVNTNILGKVYSVIHRRNGNVLEAVGMDDSEKTFLVKAEIPVSESEGFANEIRKTTSGQANPNLRFSHYAIIDGDPYYVPDSDEEDEHPGEVEIALRASKLMKEVRRRKGLQVDEQIVVHAEKQRTLNKKK